jgi:hypothetical protein
MISKLPHESVDLIKLLDQLYPERCPNKMDSEREIWMKVGERRLVNRLLRILEYHERGETIIKEMREKVK